MIIKFQVSISADDADEFEEGRAIRLESLHKSLVTCTTGTSVKEVSLRQIDVLSILFKFLGHWWSARVHHVRCIKENLKNISKK